MFIAVVYKKHAANDGLYEKRSHRDTGGWESFIGVSRIDAVEQAMKWRNKWENEGSGPYDILVGELTERALLTNNYYYERIAA